ncbi:MAG: CHAP domain-containing protein [Saprospiraceae bacterium]
MKYFSTFLVLLFLLGFIFYDSNLLILNKPVKVSSEKHVKRRTVNTATDQYKGVNIYHNGNIKNTHGRHLTKDGYNLGLKWQCVEFVKRFYYKVYDHKMPDSYGHAKDFFDKKLHTGWNVRRAMYQYANGQALSLKEDMIIVFDGDDQNPYGHIAIITAVTRHKITIAQQNWGKHTKMDLPLEIRDRQYHVNHPDVLGWLSL